MISKMKFGLLVACLLAFITSAQSQTALCVTPSVPGEWDLPDLATQDIPIVLDTGDIGDAFTTAYTVRSTEFRLIHTYSGDLGGRLISPDGTNVHLWQLGNGTIPPSTGSGGSNCNEGGYDITFSDTGGGVPLTIANENTYCVGNTDYTLASGTGGTGDPFVFNVSNPGDPAIQGTATPIDPLSNFNGDNINGTWTARITDGYAQDLGAITEVCLDVTFAGVDHQFFVSSNATCNDQVDTNSFAYGDTFYICQNVVNKGTETFQVEFLTDTSTDVGTDLSGLVGPYDEKNGTTDSRSVITSFTAGSGIFTVGTNTFNSEVTVTGTDTNFTISDTLTATETITITVVPAAPVINSPTNGSPVTGTGEPGATVTVTTPSGSTCTAVVQGDGTWSCTLSPTPVAGEDISAYQEFPVGNISPTTTVTNAIDLTAPGAPVVTAPVDGSITNNNTPTVTGTAEPGAIVVVTGPNGEACSAIADAMGDWSCVISPALIDGSNQLDVTATDSAGNTSPTTSITIDVDTSAPLAPVINVPTNGAPVTGTGEPGATVTVTTPSGSTCTAVVQGDGTWSCTLSPSPVDGEDVSASQQDPAGNTSPTTTEAGGIDTTPPGAPIITSPANGDATNHNTPIVTGTAEPGATVVVTGPNGETCTDVADVNGDWSCEIAPALADGSNQLNATATDPANNTSPAASVTIDVDTIAPTAPVIDSPTNGTPVTGIGEPGATVIVETPSGSTCTAIVQPDGTWSCDLFPDPVDGEDITAIQEDPAGNQSPPTTVPGGIDTSAPTTPVITSPSNGELTNHNTPIVTGTAEPGATVVVTGPNGETCTDVADVNGDWSCEIAPALADGSNQLDATATDPANNTSPAASVTIDVDTVAPTAPVINTPTTGTPVYGIGEPGATVIVETPSGSTCTAVVQPDGTWSCDLFPEPQNGEDITATQEDPAGNTSPPTTVPGGVSYDPNLTVFITNCVAGVLPTDSMIYSMSVTNNGNLDISGANVATVFSDKMTLPTWVCQGNNGGVCDNVSGDGDLNETVDLPVGSDITYLFSSDASGQLFEFIDVEGSVTMPNGITDTDITDNVAFDSDLIYLFIFKDGFDCAAPGTIETTNKLLESILK